MKNVFVSVETTGLNPNVHAVCKVSMAIITVDDVGIGKLESYVLLPFNQIWEEEAKELNSEYFMAKKADPDELRTVIINFLEQNKDEGEKYTLIGFEGYFQYSFFYKFIGEKFPELFYTVPVCVEQVLNLAFEKDRSKFKNMKYSTWCAGFSLPFEDSAKLSNVIVMYNHGLNLLKGSDTITTL